MPLQEIRLSQKLLRVLPKWKALLDKVQLQWMQEYQYVLHHGTQVWPKEHALKCGHQLSHKATTLCQHATLRPALQNSGYLRIN